jgi:hypothetical protein
MKEIAPRIMVDANVAFGKPVIRGTRVPRGEVEGGSARQGRECPYITAVLEAEDPDRLLLALGDVARARPTFSSMPSVMALLRNRAQARVGSAQAQTEPR